MVLSCELSRTDALVSWSHNGVPLQLGQGLELHAEGPRHMLSIPDVAASHAGLYTCQCGAGPEAPSRTFTLRVEGE